MHRDTRSGIEKKSITKEIDKRIIPRPGYKQYETQDEYSNSYNEQLRPWYFEPTEMAFPHSDDLHGQVLHFDDMHGQVRANRLIFGENRSVKSIKMIKG